MKNTTLILLVALMFTIPGFSQKKKGKTPASAPPAAVVEQVKPSIPGPVKVTTVEGITEYRLHNGLRVLLFPDNSKQTFTINVTYLVGSKHENYGETGMAHLLEHLVFKGTPKYPYNIMKELEDRGANFNGTTSLDRTNYFETLTSNDENLKWAIEMEADRMVNSFIAQKDLDSEMTVVRNEYEAGENNPLGVMFKKLLGTAYQWHSYGKSTIGERSDIENVSIERLQAFYRKYYQPDNAVVVLAGKFEEGKTLGYINEFFGAIPKPERELPVFYTREPTQDGERVVTVKRVGDVQYVATAYHIPPGSHEDYAALAIVSSVLSTQPSGRLYKALVDSKKAASLFAYTLASKEPGLMMLFAQVLKEKSLDDARTTMVKTINDLIKNPPTKEEVDRARTEILKQFELNFNNPDRIGVFLSEYIAMGDWRLFFLYRDRIEKVTAEDALRVAQQYLKDDNRTIGLFIPVDKPDRAEIPGAPDVEQLVNDYKGRAAVASGEEFDPSPANIEGRTQRSALANGMKVAYLTKKTRGEAVQLRMTLRFGDEKSLSNKATTGQYTARMLDKGTSKMTRQQIKDEFDRLKARVSIGGGADAVSVSIETTRANLAETLKLVAHVLRDPSFPADEFEKLKAEEIANIEANRTEPQSVASIRLSKHTSPYPKGHPRYAEDNDESLASIRALKLDEVKKFYKDFYGANHGTVGISGDFDEAEINAILTEQFGSWKSPASFNRIEARVKKVQPIDEKIETPDKANAFFLAQYSWEYSDNEPDYPALTIGHYMLGGGTASRLFSRIRGKEGISYGVGSFFNAGNLDKVGTFTAYAIYAPENVGRLEETFKEEIVKAATEGFTAEELENAKNGWLQSRSINRAQDAYISSTLNTYLFSGRNMNWDEELERKVKALTVDEVNAVMKKYLKYEDLSMVKAGDFAKGAVKAQGN